jgi:5,10-methylenetetrahydromethanopterin reductase
VIQHHRGRPGGVDDPRRGQVLALVEAIEAYPETERHLVIHAGHLIKANPRDEPHVADLVPFASSMALTGTAEQVSEKIAGLAALGVTELVYQPAGSDIWRELRAFASAAGLPSPK